MSSPPPLLASPPPLDVEHHALFLDLDGTLIEIEEHPQAALADEALIESLRRLAQATNGAVAIVSGRTIDDIERITQGAIANMAGLHGLDLRIGKAAFLNAGFTGADISSATGELGAMIEQGTLGVLLEDKGKSIALHYRNAPHQAARVCKIATQIARKYGLRVLHGKMVVELLPSQRTKGDALIDLMGQRPFAGRVPIAIGDDVTDEDAFAAANRLGGCSILVGPARATAARYRLSSTAALRGWLAVPTPGSH